MGAKGRIQHAQIWPDRWQLRLLNTPEERIQRILFKVYAGELQKIETPPSPTNQDFKAVPLFRLSTRSPELCPSSLPVLPSPTPTKLNTQKPFLSFLLTQESRSLQTSFFPATAEHFQPFLTPGSRNKSPRLVLDVSFLHPKSSNKTIISRNRFSSSLFQAKSHKTQIYTSINKISWMLQLINKMSVQKVKCQVGKYELGQTIGIGMFAKMRLVRDLDTGEHVAIKILFKKKVLKHELAEQIMREIATMKLIKHPSVIQLQEVMGSKSKIFIVLEYATGGELLTQ
ncbi:hypothetical protein IEQ34_011558 [Dendrobium chrysotoxum]|uniref:non-specific serine/threonine protein kinase n=1 Tax=Dendrobium chrysotoxum TaxID=161865 RepID=A0AAV7GAC0_DENCH|nr:hypothetical protein IEQ34_011558 [Dendrobium chrysotoxum]